MTVTKAQKQETRKRADNCCEFCRVSQDSLVSKFQVDHIIPTKHGGSDESDNLCLACLKCNSYKGPNVAGLDPETDDATKLFNPRKQNWHEHFKINDDATISGLTPEGRCTVFVLRINEDKRVSQRYMSMLVDEYPC